MCRVETIIRCRLEAIMEQDTERQLLLNALINSVFSIIKMIFWNVWECFFFKWTELIFLIDGILDVKSTSVSD